MQQRMDLQNIRKEAWALMRANGYASVKATALYLAVTLLLSEIGAASDSLLGKEIGPIRGMSFSFSFLGILASLVSLVLLTGYQYYCLRLHRGEGPGARSIFDPLSYAGQVVLLQIMINGLVILGASMFFLPGLYFGMCYALAPLILCEEPDANALTAMRRSRERMVGHKLELLALTVGFLPQVLGVLVAGVAVETLIWPLFPDSLAGSLAALALEGVLIGCLRAFLQPYLGLALAGFYRRVTEESGEER